jgi:hypothetical protein
VTWFNASVPGAESIQTGLIFFIVVVKDLDTTTSAQHFCGTLLEKAFWHAHMGCHHAV